MGRLTRQELVVIISLTGLILLGLAVKAYRASHPPVETPAAAPTR